MRIHVIFLMTDCNHTFEQWHEFIETTILKILREWMEFIELWVIFYYTKSTISYYVFQHPELWVAAFSSFESNRSVIEAIELNL